MLMSQTHKKNPPLKLDFMETYLFLLYIFLYFQTPNSL